MVAYRVLILVLKEKNVLKTAENVTFSIVCTDAHYLCYPISWDDVAKLKKHKCQTEIRSTTCDFHGVLQYCLSIVLMFLKLPFKK